MLHIFHMYRCLLEFTCPHFRNIVVNVVRTHYYDYYYFKSTDGKLLCFTQRTQRVLKLTRHTDKQL